MSDDNKEGAGVPVAEIVTFGGLDGQKEVSWRKGKMPPVGTRLYVTPPAVMPAAPSDAEIDALDKTFALHVMAPRGKASVREFARAVLALSQTTQPQAEPAAGEQAGAVACNGVGHTALVEAVSRAILFADCGNSEHWEANTDLAEAAIKVCNARNPPRCSYCNSATSTPIYDAPHDARFAALASREEAPATSQAGLATAARRLEEACNQRAALLTREAYLAAEAIPGMRDVLDELDSARKDVRVALTQPATVQRAETDEAVREVGRAWAYAEGHEFPGESADAYLEGHRAAIKTVQTIDLPGGNGEES